MGYKWIYDEYSGIGWDIQPKVVGCQKMRDWDFFQWIIYLLRGFCVVYCKPTDYYSILFGAC